MIHDIQSMPWLKIITDQQQSKKKLKKIEKNKAAKSIKVSMA